jgi:hypothetical protein
MASRAAAVACAVAGACLFAFAGAVAWTGCGTSTRREWQRAREAWQRHDPRAWQAWIAIDPGSVEGRDARSRLAAAELKYRRGIELLRTGAPGAREALLDGTRLGPMDPALYLPLARAYRERGFDERAAEFYKKYLSLGPAVAVARAEAQAELAALGPDVFQADLVAPEPPFEILGVAPGALVAALAAALVATLALALAAWRRRGPPLSARAAAHPELQPALAYLVGCLRHEILKHRIGAVGDAVAALARGGDPAALALLVERLYRGEPLEAAWRGHLTSFVRALGPDFALLRNERSFRAADRALRAIARLERPLARGDGRAIARLGRAFRTLRAFDGELAALTAGFARTRLDGALLAELVRAVLGEPACAQAPLDELVIAPLAPDLAVEIYKIDLAIAVKNVVRNAIVAVGRGAAPRRVALDVDVTVEPTGEESVRIRVHDSAPEPLDAAELAAARVDRGLGLARETLRRAGGALEVAPGADGYAKAVVLRLFRAFDAGHVASRPPLRAAS